MSMIRPIAWLAALVAALAVADCAHAQFQPPLTSPGSDHFWEFQPFIDPGYFQHDFQFFAPPEVNDFGGEEKPNTGFYVTFDRTDVAVTRPLDRFSFGSQTKSDFTWGNRMELGYMKGDPSGWQGVLWHVNGPNESSANALVNEVFLSSDAAGTTGQFLAPQSVDSLNQLKMTSFELNKVWRLKPYHNGTILEPLVGYRYFNVRDYFRRDSLLEVVFPPAAATDEMFINTRHLSQFINSMHGGQFGARLFRQRGHWMLSTEARIFACANFQLLKVNNQVSAVPNPDNVIVGSGAFDDFVDPFGTGGDVNNNIRYFHATQFCWGGELRGDASYELTRDINLRVGFVFLDLGQGIGRGDLLRLNNQAVQMAGVSFGFTVNR